MSRRSRLLSLAIAVFLVLALPSCKGCRKKAGTASGKNQPRPTRTPMPPTVARVVVLTSGHGIEEWISTPPAKRPTGLAKVSPGERVTFTLLLVDYRPEDLRRVDLRGKLKVTAPDGRVVLDRPDAGRGTMATLKAPQILTLAPSPDIVFTNDDQPGIYAIEADIYDAVERKRRHLSTSFELVFRK